MSLVRGAVWLADLSPTRGSEQAGRRPVVILSTGIFNQGAASLVIVCPLTTRDRGIRTHVRIEAPDGGLKETSFVLSEAIRSISKERLVAHWGHLPHHAVVKLEDILRILLEL